MITHPSLTADIAAQRRNELISEASTYRLARAIRKSRRRRGPDGDTANLDTADGDRASAARDVGRLASWEAAGQVR